MAQGSISVETLFPPKEIQLECRSCREIINNWSGRSFLRNLDPRAKWDILYYQAKMRSEGTSPEFTLVMDEKDDFTITVDGEEGEELRKVYTERELEGCNMRQLQTIGRQYDLKGVRRRDLILQILQAQTALVIKARADSMSPKG
jgi:hypothetical protein